MVDLPDQNMIIRARIHHILKIYPKLSYAMLQAGIGPSLLPAMWRPVLARMIEDGEAMETHLVDVSPISGRHNNHKIISLTEKFLEVPVEPRKKDSLEPDIIT